MTLKTLKDIDDDCDNSGWIEETMLRQEAIKWYKERYSSKHEIEHAMSIPIRQFIVEFFNLTDEDLK